VKITAMQEYGIRCMLQLVRQEDSSPLTAKEIAEKEVLTPVYVAKLLVTLRRAGLVKSIRGVKGGYAPARPAKNISVAVVLSALGNIDLDTDLCDRFTGNADKCSHIDNCGLRPVWAVLAQYIFGFLNQLTLDQLVKDENFVEREVQSLKEKSFNLAFAPRKKLDFQAGPALPNLAKRTP